MSGTAARCLLCHRIGPSGSHPSAAECRFSRPRRAWFGRCAPADIACLYKYTNHHIGRSKGEQQQP
eukprot:260526-Pyramimonas_sp.AAC.1